MDDMNAAVKIARHIIDRKEARPIDYMTLAQQFLALREQLIRMRRQTTLYSTTSTEAMASRWRDRTPEQILGDIEGMLDIARQASPDYWNGITLRRVL